ncbi:MAG: hypothetical protein WD768_13560 [Phycisphaeraceae bacterium]
MKALRSVAWLSLAWCLLSCGLVACDDGVAPPTDPSAKGEGQTMRIVSLAPALTRMIQDLGGGGLIVGVDDSHPKVFAGFALPTVGQFNQLNTEAIIQLKPTHVVAMVGAEGVPAELDKLASNSNFKLLTYRYPTNVPEVAAIMRGAVAVSQLGKSILGEDSLAALVGTNPLVANRVINSMLMQMGQVDALTYKAAPPGKKPRVLLVMEVQPQVRAFGPETVMHDVLSNYAGGYNAAIPELKPLSEEDQKDPEKVKAWFKKDPAAMVGTAPLLDREHLLDAKPDVIVLILPGAPPLDVPDLDPRLADFKGLDIPAVKNGRIVLINSLESQLPSTSLPLLAVELAKAIHPGLSVELDKITAPPELPVAPEQTPVPGDPLKPETKPEVKPETTPGTSETEPSRTSVHAD